MPCVLDQTDTCVLSAHLSYRERCRVAGSHTTTRRRACFTVSSPLPPSVCILTFWWSPWLAYQVICAGWTRGITVYRSVCMVRHLRGNYVLYPLPSLEMPQQKTNQSLRRCHPCASKFASRAVFSWVQFILHATRPTPDGGSRSAHAVFAWSVKT